MAITQVRRHGIPVPARRTVAEPGEEHHARHHQAIRQRRPGGCTGGLEPVLQRAPHAPHGALADPLHQAGERLQEKRQRRDELEDRDVANPRTRAAAAEDDLLTRRERPRINRHEQPPVLLPLDNRVAQREQPGPGQGPGGGGARLPPLPDAGQDLGRPDQGAGNQRDLALAYSPRRGRRLRGDRGRSARSRRPHRARQPGRRDHQRHRGARPGQHRPAGRQAGDGRQGRACSRSSPASTCSTSSSTRTTRTS